MTSTTTIPPLSQIQALLDLELEGARVHARSWFDAFEDSRLGVRGAADPDACFDLALQAPTPELRGYVFGLLTGSLQA